MRIAIVDPWNFTPPYNQELCRGLASMGHEVTMIGPKMAADQGRQGEASHPFKTLGLFSEPGSGVPAPLRLMVKGLRHIQGLLRLRSALRRLQPDVIHFQWLPLPLIDALFVPWLRRLAPVVLTVHDSDPYNGAGPLLLRLGNMLAMRGCDRWIVHNEVSEQHLLSRGMPKAKLHRIAHGLLGPTVDRAPERGEGDDKRLHLLQFGKIKDYKGVDVLLNALGRLSEAERERCRVSIVGKPYVDTKPYLDLIERHRLQASVELKFDFVSDDEMEALFDQADMLVFPYRGIDTSGVLMAAIARGIPVVASRLGCFAEMLSDGKEGRLVAPDDPKALAEALADVIDNPENVNAMRADMIALRHRIPGWQSIAEMTTNVYELAQTSPASTPIGAHT